MRKSKMSNWREHLYVGQYLVKETSLKMRSEGWRVNRRGVDFVAPTGKKIELTTLGRVDAHFAKGGEYRTAEYTTYKVDWSKS
jgi:hypothetical protein